MKVWIKILQFCIAFLLLTTSIGKLLDNRGFAEVLLTYDLFPEAILLPLALCMSLFELFLSLWIFSGVKLNYSSLVAILLHIQFLGLAVISNLRELNIPNCGCFGVFWVRPMSWGTVGEDSILVAVCIILFVLTKKEMTDDKRKKPPITR
jgi:hypothetical protein